MFAHLSGADGLFGVEAVGRSDIDDIERWIVEKSIERAESPGRTPFLGKRLSRRQTAPADAVKFAAARLFKRRREAAPRNLARSDDSPLHAHPSPRSGSISAPWANSGAINPFGLKR